MIAESTTSAERPTLLGIDFIPFTTDATRLFDLMVVAVAGYLAYVLYPMSFAPDFWAEYGRAVVIGTLLTPLLFERFGEYRSATVMSADQAVRTTALCTMMLAGSLLVVGFATKSLDAVSRIWGALWFALTLGLLLAGRLALVHHVRRLSASGALTESIAIVGAGKLADRLAVFLQASDDVTVEVIGVFDDRLTRLDPGATMPMGTIADLVELGKTRRIDRVIVTLPWSAERRLIEVFRVLKALAVDITLCPDLIGFHLLRRPLGYIGALPLMRVADRPLGQWRRVIKTVEDKVIGSILLLALLPVMAAVAAAVALDSPGPVLFRQKRLGFNNTEIDVFKFRTMRFEAGDAGGAVQTRRGDSRITRIGGILRKTSLDELPQLFNVVRGDMSLVGPRPHPVSMRTGNLLGHEIVEDYAHRHRVKPGITGWAQVNGYRGATDTRDKLAKRVEFDLYYIDNWSVLFDMRILLMTVAQVLTMKNAF